MDGNYDAIVIGSGVGGSAAAALLAASGLRVLLVEKRAYLGGRFSTSNHDGFLCATGGIAIQVGGPVEQVCDRIGIDSGVRPASRSAYWIDGQFHEISADGGSLRATIGRVAESDEEAHRVGRALADALGWLEPSDAISFRDWLNQYTENPRIHGLFQATIASLLTVNSWELPAAEYFKLIRNIAPLRFGYIAGGSVSLWERMADYVRARGGDVLTSCAAARITVEQGRASGARFRTSGRDVVVNAPIVVSDIGPEGTVALAGREHFERSYLALLDHAVRPTAILWMHFCSDERLFDYSALAICGTRRVNMIDMPSLDCPGLAPPGKHLYTVGGAPLDSANPGDVDGEFEHALADLRDVIPGFDQRCRVLTRTCYRGKWPGFRTRPGSPMPHRTPIRGLFNVGDASCPRGFGGSMGAARSAQIVCEDVQAVVCAAAPFSLIQGRTSDS
jgi:phytoene dehydrogenase-like protein